MIELNLKPEKKQLRQFGIVGAVVGIGMAAMVLGNIAKFAHWPDLAGYIFGGVGAFCLLGMVIFPKMLLPLYVVLTLATFPIGIVMSHVIMAFIFYCVFTPVGLIFRIIGRDPLHRKIDRDAETYWDKYPGHPSPKRYFSQF